MTQPAVSRRRFFNGILSGSALAAGTLTEVKTAFAQSVQKLGESHKAHGWETDDGYWAKVRNQFMLEEGFAYLNTGTLGPTPRPVVTAMNEYWRLMAVNPNENSLIFQDRQEQIRIEATNWALEGIPEERVRYHTCWGSWHTPHTTDIPFEHTVDLMLQIKAVAYSIEAADIRHEWDIQLFEDGRAKRALRCGRYRNRTATFTGRRRRGSERQRRRAARDPRAR